MTGPDFDQPGGFLPHNPSTPNQGFNPNNPSSSNSYFNSEPNLAQPQQQAAESTDPTGSNQADPQKDFSNPYFPPPQPTQSAPTYSSQPFPGQQSPQLQVHWEQPQPTFVPSYSSGQGTNQFNSFEEKAPSRSGIGMVGLVLAVIATVAGIVNSIFFGRPIGRLMKLSESFGGDVSQIPNDDPQYVEIMNQMNMPGFFVLAISIAGLVALVLSIVGIAQNKARAAGVIGTITSVLAPILCFCVAVAVAVNVSMS